jgi:hypothetical protein
MTAEGQTNAKILGGEILKRENHEQWFKSCELWTMSIGSQSYLKIDPPNADDKIVGKIMFAIHQGLSETDRDLAEEYDTPHKLIEALRRKYEKKGLIAASEYVTAYYNFNIDGETVDEAFNKIRSYGRKAAANDDTMKALKTDRAVFQQLLRSLPSSYGVTRDTIRARMEDTDDVEKHMTTLRDKESELKEIAHISKEKHSRPRSKKSSDSSSRYRRSRRSSSSSSSNTSSRQQRQRSSSHHGTCDLCRQEGHGIRDCPRLSEARNFLRDGSRSRPKESSLTRKSSIRSTSRDNDSKTKSVRFANRKHKAYTADSDSEGSSEPEDNNDPKSDDGAYTSGEETAHIAAEVSGLDILFPSDENVEDSVDEDAVSDYETAYEGDTTEAEERAMFVKQNPISELSEQWIPDSGASSHMTDQLNLFDQSTMRMENGRRAVKVGGGQLAIKGKGTVMAHFRKSPIRLKNALFVPRLGANLLSIPKLTMSGLTATISAKKMEFFQNNEPDNVIIRAEKLANDNLFTAIWAKTDHEQAYIVEEPDHDTQADIEEMASSEIANPSEAHQRKARITLSKQEYVTWHRRLGHISAQKMRTLYTATTMKKAVPTKYASEEICDVCAVTKMKKRRTRTAAMRKLRPLELVSIDISGDFDLSFDGFKYFLEIVDNHSRFCWIIPLRTKHEAIEELEKWRRVIELETGLKLGAARTDNANELTKVLTEWQRRFGVKIETSAVHTSSQNGLAERTIQTTQQLVRSMLEEAKLPEIFWSEFVRTAAYTRNSAITLVDSTGKATAKYKTPWELWYKVKPSIEHLKVPGCLCYILIDKEDRADLHLSKFGQRARRGIFMGYTPTTAQYRVYMVDKQRVRVYDARNVRFNETSPGGMLLRNPNNQGDSNLVGESLQSAPVDNLHVEWNDMTPDTTGEDPRDKDWTPPRTRREKIALDPASVGDRSETSDNAEISPDLHNKAPSSPNRPRIEVVITKKPSKGDYPEIPYTSKKRSREDDDDQHNSGRRKLARALFAHALVAQATRGDQECPYVNATTHRVPIPINYEAAVGDPVFGQQWIEAIDRELNEITANGTWEIAPVPEEANIVTSRWVFDVKYLLSGDIERFKARLVARGFSQVYGIDFEETFAPTMRIDSLRILLCIMALEDMEAEQVDVNNAFTESELDEDIYMQPPPGFPYKLRSGQALLLKRSLYGLKQSARQWYKRCARILIRMGFRQVPTDPCVFIRDDGAIIGVYVDDLLILTPKGKTRILQRIKDDLRREVKIKELGKVEKILGVRVIRNRKRRTVDLDQSGYMRKFLHEFGMQAEKARPTSIPINGGKAFRKTQMADEVADQRLYQRQIGSMMFAMVYTRPDIALAISKLSQYMSNPGDHHAAAAKGVLRYLRSSVDLCIRYGPTRDSHERVLGYTDSSYADCPDTRRSTLGYIFVLGGGPICWGSRRQRSVSSSTTEAEYMAISQSSKQAMWIRQFLTDIRRTGYIGKNAYSMRMYEDNQSTIVITKEAQINERTKHIDVAAHYVRELVRRQQLDVRYKHTTKMLADLLTKPLTKEVFLRLREKIGLVNRPLR